MASSLNTGCKILVPYQSHSNTGNMHTYLAHMEVAHTYRTPPPSQSFLNSGCTKLSQWEVVSATIMGSGDTALYYLNGTFYDALKT